MRIQLTDLPGSKVIRHPYRTARVESAEEIVPYSSGDDIHKLSQALADTTVTPGHQARVGNHVTYKIIFADGRTACVQFSDSMAIFGSDIVIGRW